MWLILLSFKHAKFCFPEIKLAKSQEDTGQTFNIKVLCANYFYSVPFTLVI